MDFALGAYRSAAREDQAGKSAREANEDGEMIAHEIAKMQAAKGRLRRLRLRDESAHFFYERIAVRMRLAFLPTPNRSSLALSLTNRAPIEYVPSATFSQWHTWHVRTSGEPPLRHRVKVNCDPT